MQANCVFLVCLRVKNAHKSLSHAGGRCVRLRRVCAVCVQWRKKTIYHARRAIIISITTLLFYTTSSARAREMCGGGIKLHLVVNDVGKKRAHIPVYIARSPLPTHILCVLCAVRYWAQISPQHGSRVVDSCGRRSGRLIWGDMFPQQHETTTGIYQTEMWAPRVRCLLACTCPHKSD